MDAKSTSTPLLNLNFLSHGTLEARDIIKSREFYELCLGLEVVQTSDNSLLIRLGGNNTIAVVGTPKKQAMSLLNHNGLDVESQEEVDEAYESLVAHQEQWEVGKITKPMLQHGTYSFFFKDLDDNWWEILTNPPGGYAWLFEKGDQEGRGHMDKNSERPSAVLS